MSESDARQQYSEILERVSQDEDRIIIEKDGVPVAAIVPKSAFRAAEEGERRQEESLASLRDVQDGFADVPEEELDRKVQQALAEAKRIQPTR